MSEVSLKVGIWGLVVRILVSGVHLDAAVGGAFQRLPPEHNHLPPPLSEPQTPTSKGVLEEGVHVTGVRGVGDGTRAP